MGGSFLLFAAAFPRADSGGCVGDACWSIIPFAPCCALRGRAAALLTTFRDVPMIQGSWG